MSGIAHISFTGGGVVLPVRSPYDRQLLVEHIAQRVRAKGDIRVTLDHQCWSVRLHPAALAARCGKCGQTLRAACYIGADGGAAYCIRCVFGEEVPPTPRRELLRTVG